MALLGTKERLPVGSAETNKPMEPMRKQTIQFAEELFLKA
jgi:hypothetical protein